MEYKSLIELIEKPQSGEWGKDDETGTGIPVIRTTNFTDKGIINYSNIVTRNIPKEKIEKKSLRKGDIIIEKSGGSDTKPVGRVVFFDGEENTFLFNNFTGILRVRPSVELLPKYLFYYLFYFYWSKGTVKFENKTTGLHNLKLEQMLNSVYVPFVDSDGQRKIVSSLDSVRNIINHRENQLNALDNLIKARFVEMFGDPVIGNVIKENKHKIGDFASVTKLAGFEFTKYIHYKESGDIIMLRGLNCKNGHLVLNDIKWIDKETSDLLPRSKLYYGDILMTYAGTIGDVAMVDEDNKYHLAPNVGKITIEDKDNYNPVYLMYLFLFSHEYIMTFASQVAQASINMEKIRNFEYYFPSIELQNKFAEFVQQTDKSKVVVQKALDEAQLLFDSLMQQYFG